MRALIAVPRSESNRAILKGICVWCEENSSDGVVWFPSCAG